MWLLQFHRTRQYEGFVNAKDFGLVGDGETDDTAAQIELREWAITQDFARIRYPPGIYKIATLPLALFSTGVSTGPFKSPRRILIYGPGATITDGILGSPNQAREGHRALVASVNPGERTVFCIEPNAAELFLLDINGDPLRWTMMSGLEMQQSSSPPNLRRFEYCQIEGVSLAANSVTFVEPLRYTYLETWPLIEYNSPAADGPATLYCMDPRWDMDIAYEGAPLNRMTFARAGAGTNFAARRATLRNVNFSGYGWFPSASIEASAYDTHLGNQQSEVDKLVDRLKLKRCTGHFLSFQSSSVNDTLIEDSKIETAIHGTPTKITIRRTETASLRLHPAGYGWTDEAIVEDSIYAEQQLMKNLHDISSFTSIADGVFVRPIADGPIRNALPGARWFIFTSDGHTILGYVGRVTEVRQSGSDIVVVTTMTGGIPTFTSTYAAAKVGSIGVGTGSFSGNTGCAAAVEMSLAPVGTKLMEYMNRDYDGSVRAHSSPPLSVPLVGYLDYFKVDVQHAYTGVSGTAMLACTSQFGTPVIDAAHASAQWGPKVNLKIPGVRIFSPAGLSGGESGDVAAAIGADTWLASFIGPYFEQDISGESAAVRPIVNIEALTHQGD